jgi:hypothetical protein
MNVARKSFFAVAAEQQVKFGRLYLDVTVDYFKYFHPEKDEF